MLLQTADCTGGQSANGQQIQLIARAAVQSHKLLTPAIRRNCYNMSVAFVLMCTLEQLQQG
jgi:hypothetical protein